MEGAPCRRRPASDARHTFPGVPGGFARGIPNGRMSLGEAPELWAIMVAQMAKANPRAVMVEAGGLVADRESRGGYRACQDCGHCLGEYVGNWYWASETWAESKSWDGGPRSGCLRACMPLTSPKAIDLLQYSGQAQPLRLCFAAILGVREHQGRRGQRTRRVNPPSEAVRGVILSTL